ncbi:MAG: glycoside hydrolase [Actinomycetota bacterium]|nr:glycoside hydrolase [Actinomycetota bacterium]
MSGDGSTGRLRWRVAALTGALALVTSLPVPVAGNGDGSGGPAVAHRADGRTVTGAAALRAAPDARMFRLGHGAGEPTLGITAKGEIFVTASDGCVTSCPGSTEAVSTVAPGGRAVYSTSDEGKTWVDVTPKAGDEVPTHVLTLDPYVYVDEATSRVFDIDLTVVCSILSFSDDAGDSWISNPLACGEPVNDHQTVFAGPPVKSPTVGYENILYYCFNHPGFTKCSKSLDGGITFVPTANISPPDCSGLNGHGVAGRDGTIYVPMASSCGAPTLAISRDEADTWETVRVAPMGAAGGDPSVAIDRQGNLYYLFVEAGTRLPHLTVSTDGGKRWSDPIMVGAPGVEAANLATLDVGDAGNVAIAYYGTTGGGTWNGYLSIGRGVLGGSPFFYSGPINDPAEPLKVGECGPGRCGRVLDFIDVEIAPNGRAWGSYVDACQKECEATGVESIADNEGIVGTFGAASASAD